MILNVLIAIVCAVLVSGCDFKGTADCRFADSIEAWTQTADGKPDTVTLDANGDVSYAENIFFAAYVCQGSIIDGDGMPIEIDGFNPHYYVPGGAWYPSEFMGYQAEGETGENGAMRMTLFRDDFTTRDLYQHYGSLVLRHPNRATITASSGQAWYGNRGDCTGERDLLPFMVQKWVTCRGFGEWTWGGYWYSGTLPKPQPVAAMPVNGARYGVCAIPDNCPDAPDFGVIKAQTRWVREKGGVLSPTTVLAASMTKDPIKLAAISPYRFEVIVRCAEPIEAQGLIVNGVCRVIHPTGSPLIYPMTAEIETEGGNGFLAIRSRPIIPVEPYCWKDAQGFMLPTPDPYWVGDRLIVPVKLNVLGGAGTKIEFEITGIDSVSAATTLAPYWLSSNKTLDMNSDGIVNFVDLQ